MRTQPENHYLPLVTSYPTLREVLQSTAICSRARLIPEHELQVSLRYNRHTELHEILLSSGAGLFGGSHNTSEAQTWARAYRGAQKRQLMPKYGQSCHRFLALWNEEEDENSTPVHQAIIFSQGPQRLSRLREALISYPHNVDTLNGAGQTPLHWTVFLDDLHTARVLLDFGADVNHENSLGNTPIYVAALTGQESLVRLFLDHDADVMGTGARSPLLASVMAHDTPVNITAILLRRGSNPNTTVRFTGNSALHMLSGEPPIDLVESFSKTQKLDLLFS